MLQVNSVIHELPLVTIIGMFDQLSKLVINTLGKVI